MSHELLKLTSKLCNTPLLVTEEYLDKVFEILKARNDGVELGAVTDSQSPRKRSLKYFPDKALGVIDIHGAISDVPYYGMCGEDGVSHQSIREEMKALIEAGAKVVVMDSDTNGGLAHMAFESANYIRDLADENGVHLISYVSHKSFSAGYVYSAVAHEVITNPSSEVGSIGVMMRLRNVNGAMKNMGIQDIYVTAGVNKVPFDAEGNFTEDFLAEQQEGVLDLYDQFTSHVAMWRGMEQPAVIALGANSYTAKKALANGLVDKQMTLEEFKSYLEELTIGSNMRNPVTNLFSKTTNPRKETAMSDKEVDVQAQLDSLKTNLEAEMTSALAKMEADWQAKLEAKDAELNQYRQAIETQEKEKKEAKAAERVATMAAILGDAKGAEMAASLEALSDEAFASVAATMKTTAKAKEETLQAEVGAQGDVVVTEDVTTSYSETVQKNMQEFLNKQNKKGAK